MTNPQLTQSRIIAGRWEGRVETDGSPLPKLVASIHGEMMQGLSITAIAGTPNAWRLGLAIPADRISDGVHTFLISDKDSGVALASFVIAVGVLLEDDIRAKLDLVRAELDLLKRAFRRHFAGDGA